MFRDIQSHPILRMCLLFFFFYPLSSINYLFPLCNWFRPVGRVDAASDGAMCWELLAAGRQFSRVLGTSWSCEGELGTSWLLKGRLYFQKCCHHLLLVFQAEENMCNPFETIQLLKKKFMCISLCNYFSLKNILRLIWHHVTWRTDRAKSFQESALLGCCLKIFNLLFYISESWSCFQKRNYDISIHTMYSYYVLCIYSWACQVHGVCQNTPFT